MILKTFRQFEKKNRMKMAYDEYICIKNNFHFRFHFSFGKNKQMNLHTRLTSIGNTKSAADRTILLGPFDNRFFNK